MKKFLIILLCVILAVGAGLGIFFIVRAANNKKDTNNTSANMKLLQDEYVIGEKIIFDYFVFSDVQYKRITYSLNNGSEQTLTGFKTGESKEHEEYRSGSGKYYIDTMAQIIDTTEMDAGYYTLVFYVYDADEARTEMQDVYMFKLIAAKA